MGTAAGARPQLIDGMLVPGGASTQREAFERFPYGLLVLDRAGRIVCCNRQATRMLNALGLPETGLTCCALLGCRQPDSLLEGECLTELALTREQVLPEIRVDVRSTNGSSAVWVTAAAIDGGDPRVVLQLRPGSAGDRRRRASSHWIADPRLRIRTLGATAVDSAAGSIGGAWLDQRTGQLLKYLIAERRRAVTVDEIGESIWPEADYAVGATNCGTYRLALEHVALDAEEFEARLSAAMAAAELDPQGAAGEIEQSLALYRGDFLADLPYAEWAMAERHRLHELACMGLRRLADIRLERRALEGAVPALERLATLLPFDEDVHRRLMELDILRGRRSDAVRRYATLRCRLRRTFGHDPDFTPADLARPRL
jgi:DNA-binding SARP family transcriptional activator